MLNYTNLKEFLNSKTANRNAYRRACIIGTKTIVDNYKQNPNIYI